MIFVGVCRVSFFFFFLDFDFICTLQAYNNTLAFLTASSLSLSLLFFFFFCKPPMSVST